MALCAVLIVRVSTSSKIRATTISSLSHFEIVPLVHLIIAPVQECLVQLLVSIGAPRTYIEWIIVMIIFILLVVLFLGHVLGLKHLRVVEAELMAT